MSEKSFHVQLLTPNGPLFEGDAVSIKVPGSEGSFEMLHNHAPIVSTLGVGKVIVKKADNTDIIYAVNGGFVEMNNNKVTLLAEEATESGKIDVENAREAIKSAKEKLKEMTSGREEVEKELEVAKNLLKTAG